MSAFGGLILTNRGRALQAKAQAGVQLKFTSIRVGDGQVGGQAISELTDLIHTVKTLDITKLKTLSGGKAVVGGTLSNSGLTTGFYWREIGVFAEDPDLGEILYCYGNAGDQAEYIPADGGADLIEKSIDVVILVSNASNISAVIDQSLIFVSMGDFLEHTGNTIAHVTQEERETWNAKETPAGAQAKANTAEANAKAYTDAHEQKAAPHSGHETPAGAQAKAEAAAAAAVAAHDTKEKHIAYAVASGTNTYTVSIPGITQLVEGMSVKIKFANGNTGASTLNINGLGAKSIVKGNGGALTSGYIKAGQILHLVYTGSNFQLLGEGGEYGTATPAEVLKGYTIGTEDGVKEGTLELTGNATTGDVLAGKTFYNTNAKSKQAGTMPNNGSQSATLTITGSGKPTKTIPAGYTTGGTITAQVNSNQASHIEDGYNLGGCVGTYKGKYIVDDLANRFSVPFISYDDRCGGGIDNDYVYFTRQSGVDPTILRFNHSGTLISSAYLNPGDNYYGGTFNVHGAVFASGASRNIYIYNAYGAMIKTITLAAIPVGAFRGVGYTLGRVLYVTSAPLICLDNDSGTRITSQTLNSYYGGFISNFNNTVVFSLTNENKEEGGEYAGRVYYVRENGNTITKLNESLRFMHININMLKKFFV